MKNFETTYNEKEKIWSGLKIKPKYEADCSIGKAALEAMQKNSKKIGQICYHNGKEYKYDELADMSIAVAQRLTKLGLQQCDVIGVCASNTDFLAPLFFGAMLKGLIVSSLDVSYDKEGIKHTFNMTQPKLMFCDGGIYDRVKAALDECGLKIKIYTMRAHIEGVPAITEFLKVSENKVDFRCEKLQNGGSQTAVILCSSGTTGLPKGVTMSHEDLLNATFLNLQPNDRLLNFSTLHWYAGPYIIIWGTLTGLTRIISADGFTPESFLDIVEKYEVTTLLTPPSQLALTLISPKLQTAKLDSVRAYCLAGSALSYALVKQMQPHFKNATFYNAYGMSEARTATATGVCVEAKGRTGQLAPYCTYKVINDEGQVLGPNEIGELVFTSPFKWLGYYGNEKATAAAFDADGWINTGDMGYFDESGYLYIVDRKKDILKYNNFHYFPTEIEHVIYEVPDVVEVCVFGLPDVISTDLPAAAVVRKNGSNLKEADICEHVARHMAHFKHLRGGVYFVEQIPKTSTGKPLRSETRKMCEKLRSEQ